MRLPKILCCFLLLPLIVFPYSVETVLSEREISAGDTFTYRIRLLKSEEKNVFRFPEDLTFPGLVLVKSYQEQGKILKSSNDILAVSEYIYTLKAVTNGVYRIPVIKIEVVDPQTATVSDDLSTPEYRVRVLKKKSSLWDILWPYLTGFFVSFLSFLLIKRLSKIFKENRIERELENDRKILEKYRLHLKNKEQLKFRPDQKEWFVFLLNEFKKYYFELQGNETKERLAGLYNTVLSIEEVFKFQQGPPRQNHAAVLKEVEDVFEKGVYDDKWKS